MKYFMVEILPTFRKFQHPASSVGFQEVEAVSGG